MEVSPRRRRGRGGRGVRRRGLGVNRPAAHLECAGRRGRRQQLLPRHGLVSKAIQSASRVGRTPGLSTVRRREPPRRRLPQRPPARHAPRRLRALPLRRDPVLEDRRGERRRRARQQRGQRHRADPRRFHFLRRHLPRSVAPRHRPRAGRDARLRLAGRLPETDSRLAGARRPRRYRQARESRASSSRHESSHARPDAKGATVKQADSPSKLEAGGKGQVVQQLTLERPHLWDGVRDPYLYKVYVEVYENGALRDRVEQPLGLRFFSVNADEGFFLNGWHLGLHGVCRHQDRLDKGWAISEADEGEDFALIREMGANAVRVAHYQQSQLWYTLADEQGVVMWAEIPFVDDALDTPLFFENAREQLRELIRQNYNHPAIIFWGVGNETKQPAADALIAQLAAAVRLEDPTRPSTYASDHADDDTKNWHTDLVAFNRYFGWYSRSTDDFPVWADRVHREFPRAVIAVSEYGAGARTR